MEGWASMMWRKYTGVLVWKTQNPWAGLRGQLYDWRLTPTGAYFGVKLACELVHVQLNLHSRQVSQKKGAQSSSEVTHIVLPSILSPFGDASGTLRFPSLQAMTDAAPDYT